MNKIAIYKNKQNMYFAKMSIASQNKNYVQYVYKMANIYKIKTYQAIRVIDLFYNNSNKSIYYYDIIDEDLFEALKYSLSNSCSISKDKKYKFFIGKVKNFKYNIIIPASTLKTNFEII